MAEIRKDIKTWLMNWFYTEGEVDTLLNSKVNKNQGTAGKNVVTDSSGVISLEDKPTIPDVTGKADKAGGASQVTDTSAAGYTNISASLSSSSTVADIFSAINSKFGNLDLDVIIVTQDKGTATAAKMNKLYIEVGTTTDVYFVEASTSGSTTTYEWVKLEDIIFDDLSISWADITNNPFSSSTPSSFATSGHGHGSISNTGTLTSTASSVKNVVVTDISDNVKVASFSSLNTGSFSDLQALITAASSGDVIILNKDYKNTGNESQVTINKTIALIGKGHMIDADGHSRCIEVTGSNVLITGCYFVNGSVSGYGGGVCTGEDSQIVISDCSFNECTSTNDGGGIFLVEGGMSDCIFNNCSSSESNGGGASIVDSFVSDCHFNKCNADYGGGVDINEFTSSSFSDCVFNDCTSNYGGGGIFSSEPINVYNCVLNNSTLNTNVTNHLYLTDEIDLVTSGTYEGYIVFHTR